MFAKALGWLTWAKTAWRGITTGGREGGSLQYHTPHHCLLTMVCYVGPCHCQECHSCPQEDRWAPGSVRGMTGPWGTLDSPPYQSETLTQIFTGNKTWEQWLWHEARELCLLPAGCCMVWCSTLKMEAVYGNLECVMTHLRELYFWGRDFSLQSDLWL
jgi:hypothetical protein